MNCQLGNTNTSRSMETNIFADWFCGNREILQWHQASISCSLKALMPEQWCISCWESNPVVK